MSSFNYPWFKADPNDFNFKEGKVGGDDCVLVTPKPGFNGWNSTNSMYRSAIFKVDDGTIVSMGFKKFTNLDELPHFDPVKDLSSFHAVEKIDGTCLIVSKYNKELIIRTRGSFGVDHLPNASEIKQLLKCTNNFTDIFESSVDTCGFSVLIEWVSPKNTIVIKHKKPKFYLIGAIKHTDLEYTPQSVLDFIAFNCNGLERPEISDFDEDFTLDNLKTYVKPLQQTEGKVVYFDDDQCLKKFKTDWYLKLHRAKSFLASKLNVLEWLYDNSFIDFDKSFDLEAVKQKLETEFDHEIMVATSDSLDEINETFNIISGEYTFTKKQIEDADCKTPEDVLELQKKNPALSDEFMWHVFRKTMPSKVKVLKMFKEIFDRNENNRKIEDETETPTEEKV